MDEDCQDRLLVKLLRNAGHDVISVNESDLMGQPDSIILDRAKTDKHVLLTYNCDDFENLHQINSNHSGILSVYQNANLFKNIRFKEIVRAINNIEKSEMELNRLFIPLNQWNY
jgi:predicted nuclease of predicted toxin-antitoxin system